MKLLDIPTDINGYKLENFDQKFNGEVSARFALVNSLNIPPVRLLQNIGLEKFIFILTKAKFSDIDREKKNLGLSLILGGCDVRLEQLTKFFTVFSHNGKLFPLNYITGNNVYENKAVKIFTPAAPYITSQILTTN